MKRVFLIVLDSCGAGAMPDSANFGDVGVHTLRSCATSDKLHIPTLRKLGIGNIDGQDFLGKEENPTGAVARLAERSMGKDTTIGHWEIAGLVSPDPLPRKSWPSMLPMPSLRRVGMCSLSEAAQLLRVCTPTSPNFSLSGMAPAPQESSTIKNTRFIIIFTFS